METEILARVQFAVTIMFHYIYPPLSIGLGLIMVIIEGMYLRSGDEKYKRFAKFWTRVFALTFAIGVATGIVMEFEFGTNWSHYSRYVGDVFGSALAAEGVFAFFLESGFLSILLFGWDRVGPKVHFFSTLMVALGAHFSAIWIIVANSWMQTPAGFHIVGEGLTARAEIIDFWAMVFNPSSMIRLSHSVVGCWLAGAFLVISVAAYYLLKGRHPNFSRTSLHIGLMVALVACVLQAILGDISARVVAEHQPMKMAALEGIYRTEAGAPLYLFGLPNDTEQRVDYAIKIPNMLSLLLSGNPGSVVPGLDKIPAADWPRVPIVFQSYHLMLYMWGAMCLCVAIALYKWWRGTLLTSRWFLRVLVGSVMFPQIANQAGWMCAEVGRYPWIVYNLLRISEGLSRSVTANQILASLIMFGFLYLLLFALFIFLLDHKIKVGPTDEDDDLTYHNQERLLKELEQ